MSDPFPDSTHVTSEALLHALDADIWNHTRINGYVIVTADADFSELATAYGPPPKVIWLRGCNYPASAAESLIRGQAIRIAEFFQDETRAVLIITP